MEKLTYEEMALLVVSVTSKVIKENDLDYMVVPVTYREFCKIMLLKKGAKLRDRIKYIRTKKGLKAFNDIGNKWIIIMLSEFDEFEDSDTQAFFLVYSCFHELRHCIQCKFSEYSYESFLKETELKYRSIDKKDYADRHDLYSFEIGADLYAVNKTREFLKKHLPSVYKKFKDTLDTKEENVFDLYYVYDPLRLLLPLLVHMKEKKERIDSPIFRMFYDEDCNLKPIEELEKEEGFDKLDKRVIYYMIYSYYYTFKVPRKPSKKELELLKESNNFIEKVCINRADMVMLSLDKTLGKKLEKKM